MSDLNRVMLIGRLGKDPEQRYMPNGKAVCNFSIATSERWKKDGEKQERTEWHNVVAFDKLGEICGEYLRKGSQVFIEGKLQTRSWEDKEGVKRYTTEIRADQMVMLGGRGGDSMPRDSGPPPSDADFGRGESFQATDDDVPF